MCGILSYYSSSKLSEQIVLNCLNSLKSIRHRGPDGEGVVLINTETGNYEVMRTYDTPSVIESTIEIEYEKYNLLLGHRRLSIIDLSVNGHQPMFFNDNCITFNGEIYNYIEIRQELKANGYHFSSNTDTEVILKAYDFWGDKCLEKFNGMWSFIIWDNENKSIMISNDRFGVKPLYSFKNNETYIFTSEIRQFKYFPEIKLSVNEQNYNLFLKYGYTPLDNTTYFNEIKRFPKSSLLKFNFSNYNNENYISYYSIYKVKKRTELNLNDTINEFSSLLTQSIKIRRRSDVKLGVSISGGIDSTLILQFLNQLTDNEKLQTFSAISPNKIGDESKFIHEVHKHFEVDTSFSYPLKEFSEADFYDFLSHVEFPVKTMSFYAQWNISKLMKRKGVTINLVGQGADEVFGGYGTHYIRYLRHLILKGNLTTYFKEINAYSQLKGVKKNILHRIIILDIGVLLMFKLGLKKIDVKMLNHWNKTSDITEFLKNDLNVYELPFFLHSDDRSSMAHSIETRHPFLDYRIVDFGYSLSNEFCFKNGWSKYILRKSMQDSLNKIKWRKDKKGYTVPNDELIKKILPESKNLQFDFRKLCLERVINSI